MGDFSDGRDTLFADTELQRTPVTEYERTTEVIDLRIGKGLHNDLRSDPRRITHGDANKGSFSQVASFPIRFLFPGAVLRSPATGAAYDGREVR
jgi:hypothetical protein